MTCTGEHLKTTPAYTPRTIVRPCGTPVAGVVRDRGPPVHFFDFNSKLKGGFSPDATSMASPLVSRFA
jgi:hypothetical protein